MPAFGDRVWVKVTHPHAHFEQQVRDATGDLVGEQVIAATDPRTHQQRPVPMQVTFTRDVEKALQETPLHGRRATPNIEVCSEAEVAAFLAGETPAAGPERDALAGREGYITWAARTPRTDGTNHGDG